MTTIKKERPKNKGIICQLCSKPRIKTSGKCYLTIYLSWETTFCAKILHSLQGQSSGFHCFKIFKICLSKLHISFKQLGTRSHILVHDWRYFQPHATPCPVFMRDLENWEFCLRMKGLLFCLLQIDLLRSALIDHYLFYIFRWLKLGDFVHGPRQNHLFLLIH